jgi:hypothetical protein
MSLSDKDRERVRAKARADRRQQGLPEVVEDVKVRRRIGALLVRVRDGARGSHRGLP